MRLIVDAFWVATSLAARVLAAPLEVYIYFLSLLLCTETHRSNGTGRTSRGRQDDASCQ
jgi:hypothetical protein